MRPRSESSPRTRSWLALGTSILFRATTIGTPAALACSMASWVCGMIPSSAATTRTTPSVTLAPRARRPAPRARRRGPRRAPRGERLVAGGVDKRYLAAVALDLVGADVLSDAAGLPG